MGKLVGQLVFINMCLVFFENMIYFGYSTIVDNKLSIKML